MTYIGRLRVEEPFRVTIPAKARVTITCRPGESVLLREIFIVDLVLVELRVGRCPVDTKQRPVPAWEALKHADLECRVYELSEAWPVPALAVDVTLIVDNPHDHEVSMRSAEFETVQGTTR
jgi:hypothetical protein